MLAVYGPLAPDADAPAVGFGIHTPEEAAMSEERNAEQDLLHPTEKWYYNLLTGEVSQDQGPDRLGPYDSEHEAKDALELARKRNEEWDEDDDEWNGKQPKE